MCSHTLAPQFVEWNRHSAQHLKICPTRWHGPEGCLDRWHPRSETDCWTPSWACRGGVFFFFPGGESLVCIRRLAFGSLGWCHKSPKSFVDWMMEMHLFDFCWVKVGVKPRERRNGLGLLINVHHPYITTFDHCTSSNVYIISWKLPLVYVDMFPFLIFKQATVSNDLGIASMHTISARFTCRGVGMFDFEVPKHCPQFKQ